MIFLLELLHGLPFVCFVMGAFSSLIICASAGGYGMYLCDPADAPCLKNCGKWTVFFIILFVICLFVGCLSPRAEIVAIQWTNEQVNQGKMTPEQQTEFISKYKERAQ